MPNPPLTRNSRFVFPTASGQDHRPSHENEAEEIVAAPADLENQSDHAGEAVREGVFAPEREGWHGRRGLAAMEAGTQRSLE